VVLRSSVGAGRCQPARPHPRPDVRHSRRAARARGRPAGSLRPARPGELRARCRGDLPARSAARHVAAGGGARRTRARFRTGPFRPHVGPPQPARPRLRPARSRGADGRGSEARRPGMGRGCAGRRGAGCARSQRLVHGRARCPRSLLLRVFRGHSQPRAARRRRRAPGRERPGCARRCGPGRPPPRSRGRDRGPRSRPRPVLHRRDLTRGPQPDPADRALDPPADRAQHPEHRRGRGLPRPGTARRARLAAGRPPPPPA